MTELDVGAAVSSIVGYGVMSLWRYEETSQTDVVST